ncbi:MAG: dihydrodipicolinate synthase family protein [Burkholderiaceae bacterium]
MNSTAALGIPGLWPALMTPLDAALAIDHAKFAAHARGLLAAGCGGVTPFGTTGEGPSFSVAERSAAVDALIAGGIPAPRILASVSCAALPDTIALTRHAQRAGCWGVLLMPPFFFKGVGDAGIVDSYTQVLDAVPDRTLRVVLYHIPQVSGVALSHAVIAELLRRYGERIVAIKDSAGERAHALALAEAFMPMLGVHVGHELDLPAMARYGSRGAVSGLANFMPRLVHRLACQPDAAVAAADLARVERLLAWLGGYALIPALKAVMAVQTGDAAWLRVRAPLKALDAALLETFSRELAALELDASTD